MVSNSNLKDKRYALISTFDKSNLKSICQTLKKFSSKNVVVTGGTGLIGREIANILVEAGANVRVISLDKIKVH